MSSRSDRRLRGTSRWTITALAISLVWTAPRGGALRAEGGERVVVCLGDSITRGVHLKPEEAYPAVLAKRLAPVKVLNAGVPGNTSAQGLARLDRDVLGNRPAIVVVLFGTNDSVLTGPGKYRVPVDEYAENLRKIVRRCAQNRANVVLCTLLPIQSAPYFQRHPREYYDAQGGLEKIVRTYRSAAVSVAHQMRVPVVELYAAFEKDASLLRPAPDGVHPSPKGCEVIAARVADRLSEVLVQRAAGPKP